MKIIMVTPTRKIQRCGRVYAVEEFSLENFVESLYMTTFLYSLTVVSLATTKYQTHQSPNKNRYI